MQSFASSPVFRGHRACKVSGMVVSDERMRTRWQCCAFTVLVIVLMVSNREATAGNQTVQQKIRDDPDLSEVRLISNSFKCIFVWGSITVFVEYIIVLFLFNLWGCYECS